MAEGAYVMQYLNCRFQPWDQRTYTYANHGEPIPLGAFVEVAVHGGTAKVEVVGYRTEPPDFVVKPILRVVRSDAT